MMAEEAAYRTRLFGEMYTGPRTDEVLVRSMAKQVVEHLKEDHPKVYVGGWSGVGSQRVMDHVAAILHKNEDEFFSGCARVRGKPFFPVSPKFEIRNSVQELLQTPLMDPNVASTREEIFWRGICTKLKWKPIIIMIENENLLSEIEIRELGIPYRVTDREGNSRSFMKIVFATWDKTILRHMAPVKEVEEKFHHLPDEVAIQMILHEAHSAAVSTQNEYLPSLLRWQFYATEETMTSVTLGTLVPSVADIGLTLTGQCVIRCLLCFRLFNGYAFPLDYLRSSEEFPLPCLDHSESSWKLTLLFTALFNDLRDRCLLVNNNFKLYSDLELILNTRFQLNLDVEDKIFYLVYSSSMNIFTVLQGHLVRYFSNPERVDMAEWNQYTNKISFANNQIKKIVLPRSSVRFPNLHTLILRDASALEEIPNDIFRYMPNLVVLDLSFCTNIQTLPSSLSCLHNLRMLSLEGCKNLHTLEAAELDNVEVLNLDSCPLPALRKASWCHMKSLKRIYYRKGVVSLQELQLSLQSVKVFDYFDCDLGSSYFSAPRLQKCNIVVSYPNESEEIQRTKMQDAHFLRNQSLYQHIHAQAHRHDPMEAVRRDSPYDKCLEISGGEGLWSLYTLSLVFRPRLLSLYHYQNAREGIWPILELEACYIKDCNDMEYVFNSPESSNETGMPWLETLWVSGLVKLRAICNYRFQQEESFQLLKYICIQYCPNLLVLFLATISLPKLEEMEIRFCPCLEKLFEQRTAGEIVLPKLRSLRITGLPKLTRICDEGHLPLLRNLEVRGCRNLRKVPFPSRDPRGSGVAAEVVVVRGEEAWWKNLHGQGLDEDSIDFKPGFACAAPKHIPARWKRERRPRHRPHC